MPRRSTLMLLMVWVGLAAFAAAEDRPLLTNPSFEEGLEGWVFRPGDASQATVQAAGIPNLCVINSSSPGQIGWAAPELGGSAFGYFFAQGLKGAADVEETGNGDRVVSLSELYEYLKTHVAQWVGENRADSQQPTSSASDSGAENRAL